MSLLFAIQDAHDDNTLGVEQGAATDVLLPDDVSGGVAAAKYIRLVGENPN